MIREALRPARLALPLALLAAAACSDSPMGGGGDRAVQVRMGVSGGQGAAVVGTGAAAAGSLSLAGSNGTLVIDDLRMIVSEFELDGDDNANRCQAAGGGDDCEDFDSGPALVDVPLDGGQVTVTSGRIPDGTYRELEFRVRDLDDDEENAAQRAAIEQVRQQVLAAFPDWPRKASVLVSGSFLPAGGGAARPFRVFLDAEIRVELGLNPALVVSGDSASRTVDVTLDPATLFRAGGQVRDLSQQNGRLLEVELESGFRGHGGRGRGSDD